MKKTTWLTGAVATLVAGAFLAVSQPAIISATAADQTQTQTVIQQKGLFDKGHRGGKFGGRMGLGFMGGGSMEAVSQLLGMEQADLLKELQAGKSLLDIAKAKGISEDKLVDTIKAEMKSTIDEKVKDGTLTVDQAKELEQNKLTDEHIKADLNRVPMEGGKGFGFGGRMGRGLMGSGSIEAVSKLLGMEQADLMKEHQAGKSLVDIAKAKGISEDKLVDTVKAAIKSSIDEQVKAGNLTQDQAKDLQSKLTDEHIKADLNRVPMEGGKGFGFGGRGGHRGGPQGLN